MWAQIEHGGGKHRLPAIMTYLEERRVFRERWIGALARAEIPTLILWGARDPVALIEIGERLARESPMARFARLDDVGHYPQLEDPERTASAIRRFLDDVA